MILAALALAAKATSSPVVVDSTDYCVDVMTSNTLATYTDVTLAADLTVSGTSYQWGWTLDIKKVPASGDESYCYHWNDITSCYIETSYVPGGATLVEGAA